MSKAREVAALDFFKDAAKSFEFAQRAESFRRGREA